LKGFIAELSRKLAYWNLPADRKELWRKLEEKKLDLKEYLTTDPSAPDRLGAIDLKKPFEIVSFHPRQRTGEAGDPSCLWVIKIVQPPFGARRTSNRNRSGCTLLVDADAGVIRYQIDKRPAPRKTSPKPEDHDPRPLPVAAEARCSQPSERRLRVFASDPTLGVALETAGVNEAVLKIPWECDAAGDEAVRPGPVGEYLEVVDRDPASRAFYAPVDLNNPHLLAQDGLAPSEANPQFHQQMVYAVAMRTIRMFERALGRLALWSPRITRRVEPDGNRRPEEQYVQRLRIYPHALREANAYYSPAKKAVLFGYFPAPDLGGEGSSPMLVFTCLSHDIIAHEVTHALLDGMHRRFQEPSNLDVLAFHEAFSDVVALFQHFSLPEALRRQIADTRGDLESQNRLGELAQQFGQATGNRGALRSALGGFDETGTWKRATPDPSAYRRLKEPHARGALLVAAVFDAFLAIYKAAVADLLRIASGGTGVLPAGSLHPDLVDRLSAEAARAADSVLDMCVRGLDYLPPVDVTFGDYLRAVLTADFEFDPVDPTNRRVAFVEAFRRHGLSPDDVRTLSVDGLLWRPTTDAPDDDENVVLSQVRDWAPKIAAWNLTRGREELYFMMRKMRAELGSYLKARLRKRRSIPGGLVPDRPIEVHSLRPSFRTDWRGRTRFQWIIELTQQEPQYISQDELFNDGWKTEDVPESGREPDYYFRAGCTLVVDAHSGKVRYSIRKPFTEARRDRQMRYVLEDGNESLAATYFGRPSDEPFAALHRL
jgi:hypothetical protein